MSTRSNYGAGVSEARSSSAATELPSEKHAEALRMAVAEGGILVRVESRSAICHSVWTTRARVPTERGKAPEWFSTKQEIDRMVKRRWLRDIDADQVKVTDAGRAALKRYDARQGDTTAVER